MMPTQSGDAAHLDRAILQYCAWLDRLTLSENTKRTYKAQIELFAEYLMEQGAASIADIDSDAMTGQYKQYLLTERGLAASTVNVILSAVNHFFDYLGIDKANVVRESSTLGADILSKDDQHEFLNAVRLSAYPAQRAMGLLLLYQGLHLSELQRLNVDDITFEVGEASLQVRNAKRDIVRTISLDPRTFPDLQAHIIDRAVRFPAHAKGGPLFLNRSGKRLSTRSIDQAIRELGEMVNISVSASVLRNTCIANLIEAGKSQDWIAEYVGFQTTRSLAHHTTNTLNASATHKPIDRQFWLIIEDEADFRLEIETSLIDQNIPFLSFESGEQAVTWLTQLARGSATTTLPTLALIDVLLPGAYSGYDVAKYLRTFSVTKDTKVVLMSPFASSHAENDQKTANAYPDLILEKPLLDLYTVFGQLMDMFPEA